MKWANHQPKCSHVPSSQPHPSIQT